MPTTSTPTTPQTLLEAVNALLRAIRVSSVMSLLGTDLNDDAAAAKTALDDAARDLQAKGWEFNKDYSVVIDPDLDGSITLPSDCLKVKTARGVSGNRLVRRGQRLYDNTKGRHTFNIGESVTVDMVVALPFEELPVAARKLVTAMAARLFCLPRLPVGATFNYTEEYLASAWADMEQDDTDTADTDLTQTSPHFAQMTRR